MSAPDLSKSAASTPATLPKLAPPPLERIHPWRAFPGSVVPNWLQRRREIGQGPKLCYARLAQYAGRNGLCFPRQRTLGAELGVSVRTVREYIRTLLRLKLIEMERPGLGRSNRYFFLDHPWIHEGQPDPTIRPAHERQEPAAPERQMTSGLEPQDPSPPVLEENQRKTESGKPEHLHTCDQGRLPRTAEDAVAIARQLGIEEAFARQEYHAKKAVGWRDGYGNPITSWSDHLQARWPVEQRKRTERRATRRAERRPAPAHQFSKADYQQPLTSF